ncbi:MAG: diguanylate cyclase [Holophagales bacterium]|jgi:diguanylate cyclase (GGDEF)-like protein|nr:diguanylate cyclase [Holophagales bacterium]
MTVLVIVMSVMHTTVYVTGAKDIVERLELSAKGIAVSIANSLMMDIEAYKLFLETKDTNSEYYKKMQTYLATIKSNSDVKFIFTERSIDKDTTEFILDAEPIGSPYYSPPGSTDENGQEKKYVYSSKAPVSFGITHDEKWGKLLGAYAPILDRDGEILGMVGVDIDGSHVYTHLSRLNRALLTIYAFIIGMTLVSLLKFSNVVLDPLLKDKLTGAYNKRYFENFLRKEIANSTRQRRDLALLMLDLDHFKKINDTYGHVFGDKVLSSISEVIKKSIRTDDYFIRYGGEEFAVIIANSSMERVLEIAERIRKAVEETPIFNEEQNVSVKITISIGISNFNNLAINAKELVESADKALYTAKIRRNMVSVFDDAALPD